MELGVCLFVYLCVCVCVCMFIQIKCLCGIFSSLPMCHVPLPCLILSFFLQLLNLLFCFISLRSSAPPFLLP